VTYYRELTAAINDMLAHGFDSSERVAYWQRRLEEAARLSLRSPEQVAADLKRALGAKYERLVERGGLLKLHPGVQRFTYERVKPALRAELDRRTMASLDLIKLNRDQMMARQAQRWVGWATSLPVGGPAEPDRRKLKEQIRKPLASMPFEERRVFIDQASKMVSAIHATLARDGGAIAGRWRAVHAPGYDHRPEHLAMDGHVMLVRGSWADEAGLVKPAGEPGYTDEFEQPGELPYCLPGDSVIPYADGVRVSYRRWYSGELTKLVMSSGKTIRLTPNHPILTPNGWVAAGLLNEGDDVVEARDYSISAIVPEPYENDTVTTISKIFSTLQEFGIADRIVGSRKQFHGDGSNSDVDIVTSTWELSFWIKTALPKRFHKFKFTRSNLSRTSSGAFKDFLFAGLAASASFVSSFGKAFASFWSLTCHAYDVGFSAASNRYSSSDQLVTHSITSDLKLSSDSLFARSGSVLSDDKIAVNRFSGSPEELTRTPIKAKLSSSFVQTGGLPAEDISALLKGFPFVTQTTKVIKVERSTFSGHVYNLETRDGWYVADGIVTHNCRCSYVYLYALRALPPGMITAEGARRMAKARELTAA